MKLIGIKTNEEVFVANGGGSYKYSYELPNTYVINGEIPSKTNHKSWWKIQSTPVSVKEKKSQPNINRRYELIDTKMESEKLPLVFLAVDVECCDDSECGWKLDLCHLRSLYEFASDPQPDIMVDVEFEYQEVAHVEKFPGVSDFGFEIMKTQYRHEGMREVTDRDSQHQMLDQIIFEPSVLVVRPCRFSSELVYKIIREHVKLNIKPEVSTITSDYDFCFTVKKRVALAKVREYSVDVANENIFQKRKRKPKYQKRYQKCNEIECFSMTHSTAKRGGGYEGYKIIPSMEAENQLALKKKMDKYLKKLMKDINTPLCECPNCQGLGVLVEGENQ